MTVDYRGFALTISGCPYLFSTGGLPALTSAEPLWFGGEADVLTLDGWLEWPTGWSERAKPLDGDLEMGAVTFRLHDATALSGVASGYPVLSRLATRSSINVTSTPLAVAATAAALTITVASGAALDPLPRWIYCEREAMRATARVGNVVDVTRAGLGTKAEAHETRDPLGLPDVFADIPWITRRRAILWGVDADGVATVLWIGFAVRSPRLSADGARFDLPCDSLWQVLAQAPVGDPVALSVRGFGRQAQEEASSALPALAQIVVTDASVGPRARATANANAVYPTADSLRAALVARIYAQTLSRWGSQISSVSVRFDGASATLTLDSARTFTAEWEVFGTRATATATLRVAGRYGATLVVQTFARSKYLVCQLGTTRVLVGSLSGTPASWASTTTIASGLTTRRSPCLRAAISADLWVVLSAVITATTDALGPYVEGSAQIVARKSGVTVPEIAYLTDSSGLNICYRVTCDHWLDGLRFGAVDLLSDGDAQLFDWSTSDRVHRLAGTAEAMRDWLFDGRVTFGRVAIESCQLSGCTPVTRGGRLAFFAWGWPDAREVITTTLTALDLVGSPSWLVWDEGLANRIKVESDELVVDATDAGSIHRYGPGRQLAVTLLGRDMSLSRVDDPILFSRQILARMSLWADPLGIARVTVPLRRLKDLELGQRFKLTDWLIPEGTGTRGLTAALGVVIARDVQIAERGAGVVVIDAILFPRVSYGYAPCGRVESQSAADTVVLSLTPVQGVSDYSGTGDVLTFAVGDRVQLVVRNSTTLTTEDHTVLSINVAARKIQFAAPIGGAMAAIIAAAGSVVDLRSSRYNTPPATAQKLYMYVGDDTTGVIDGTADRDRPIAP